MPKDEIVLNGGRELQRWLYAFAVKAMLGNGVVIAASLLYPRDELDLRLDDPDATPCALISHLQAAAVEFVCQITDINGIRRTVPVPIH